MAAEQFERKLAAILAADVVGYSRLMGEDEAGTHARLKALRKDFIEPKIAECRGRMVKLTGDGALVEFASVVDAVQCAVEVQQSIALHNADLEPKHRIEFRVGINLGDVIIDGDDIYGDGVNVAARLEGLAPAGRRLHRGRRPSDGPRPARSRIRGSGRAAGEEHRAAGAGLAVESTMPRDRAAREQGKGGHGIRSCRTSPRSPCCRSTTSPATPSRNISATA